MTSDQTNQTIAVSVEAAPIEAVVFDVGRVLYRWDLRLLFEKLIDDPVRLDFLLNNVITEEWHFQHDAGRPLAAMMAERIAEFPEYADAIRAYTTRFNETIPGPVPGSHALVARLMERGMPIFAITNFGDEFWAQFRPTAPIFDDFRDIVVSGVEKLAKPDPAIFALAARRFGYVPGAMLFIDDNAENIASARAEGWQVHHFTDAATLERDLTACGLI